MPILNPLALREVLKESGIKKSAKTSKEDLATLLEDHNLTPHDVLENLSELMRGADSSSTRLGAIKVAAAMNGLATDNENQQSITPVTIIIQDGEFTVNPILKPRELEHNA